MDFNKYIEQFKLVFSGDLSKNFKIYATASLAWIIFIGYLTWWNGLKSPMLDKSFRWDEWFWFGIVVFGGGNTDEVLEDCGLLETDEEITTEAIEPTG